MSGAQVTALQQRLVDDGFYAGPITGYYGALTGAAVKKFQTAHGIAATGNVGPMTRAALNAGE
jgi:peptidoglycan hydrolase-like protein with peptidoglycan-binding domain